MLDYFMIISLVLNGIEYFKCAHQNDLRLVTETRASIH